MPVGIKIGSLFAEHRVHKFDNRRKTKERTNGTDGRTHCLRLAVWPDRGIKTIKHIVLLACLTNV